MNRRNLSLAQIAGTLAILVLVPTNIAKTTLLLIFWLATFWPVARVEWAMFVAASLFFTGMNAATLQQGVFEFSNPDYLGLPLWETFMWGFYFLNAKRFLGGPMAPGPEVKTLILALAYSACFAAISDPVYLLGATAALLAIGLWFFHDAQDLAFVGYFIGLGAAVEFTGVLAGLWAYPGDPALGVPLWFATLWGGVGLFYRRLVLPIAGRYTPVTP